MRQTFVAAFAAHVAGAALIAAAALNPQLARAQQWAAVAISPSVLSTGDSHGGQSQATTERMAIQACAANGANDCKVLGVTMSGCLAIAVTSTGKYIPNQYGYAAGATRDAAAANALAACNRAGVAACFVVTAPCAGDDPRGVSPIPLPPTPPGPPITVDRGLVGIWQINVTGGIWLWQIAANGTYTFRSEAFDKAGSNAGTFTASNGQYTLHAYDVHWDDQGTYTIQPGGNAVLFSGKLGTGTWTRVGSHVSTGPVPGVNIRK